MKLPLAVPLLVLLAACDAAVAQRSGPESPSGPAEAASSAAPGLRSLPEASDKANKSFVTPAVEIIGFDFLLNRFNHRFSGTSDYDVSVGSIRRNLRGPWVTDNDPFQVNQFAHPYQGSIYHTAARANGLGYWESAAYTFAGSAWWEITGEKTPPSKNDQIASGIAGSFLGEPLFRMARLMLSNRSEVPFAWREWGAAAVSPAVGFNRLVFGPRFDDSFDAHDPLYYGRLKVGASRSTAFDPGTTTGVKKTVGEIDFDMDYGLPGKPGYTYDRPFDYFAFQAAASSANGVETLSTRGLLFGTDYALGPSFRGVWGLYGNYDYLAPQIFHLSTTAVSLGSTGQWWPARDLAVQGTVLAGIGYSAASTARGVADDRDYHYGFAPRLAVAMRVVGGNRVSADFTGQTYFLGRIANRSAGRDDISRADAALTWRVTGRHAVGVKYVWSHRSATYPLIGDRRQTLGTVGVYYTLLGLDTFGTVDWREQAQ